MKRRIDAGAKKNPIPGISLKAFNERALSKPISGV
jgi:hypothetical protein